ncbi:hypothetical protein HPB47_001687 [Ixodes persulcatus]|uniref:Uncharacterized protein n=1 Tax=Ixodes persulcatus TaxID=34615 RepID=A0AC60PPR8_IXOPE|nr:hypothetical protein HPB47_001687 [Ixodes persulcatus]
MNDAVNRTYAQRLGEAEKSMNESIQRLEDGARRDDPNLREEICHLRDKVAELELYGAPAVEAIYEIRNSTDVGKETEDEVSEGSHTDLTRCQQNEILSALRNTGTQCDTDDFQESPHNSEALKDCTVKFAPEKHVPDIAEKRMDSIKPTIKEEIIAGDGNVARIARALIEEIRAPQSCHDRTATTQVVHELLETYKEQARNVPRLYILHVGVNDILRGEQPDAIVERLRMKWTNRKASLAICSVPESDRRGKRIHAATMLLNARLKQLCKSIKARFIDLSRAMTSKGAMQKDGLQYGEESIRVVTERLGAVASRFLVLRRRDKDLRLKTQVKGHQPPLSNQSEYILQPQSEQLAQVPTFPEIGVEDGHARQRKLSNVNSENGSTCIPGVTPFPWLRPPPGRHDAAGGCANGESHSPPTIGGNAVLKATDGEEVWAYYGFGKGKHDCVRNDVQSVDRSHSVLLMGDFDGHLVELDRREDKNGQMLRQLEKSVKENTHEWLSNRLQKIVVDDNGELSVGSDHSTILLHFGAIQRHRSRPKRALTFRLREGDIEAVCQDFEESEQRMNAATYEEYATERRQAVAKRSVARSAQGKIRLAPWWDAEIGRAIRYRQDENREHRQALKSFGKGSETLQLWEEYQRRKALTQAITYERAEKKVGEKFWRYIGSHDGKDSSPQLVDPDNGKGMRDEIPHLEDAPQSTTADQNATVVGRVQVERAQARLNGSTAQGLDGISAKVLKGLGPDAREHLAHLFSRICCGDDPIPSDWRRGRVSFIPKTGGYKQLLHDYRPLTVTPVAYSVFATIINGRITQCAEESGILTEWQNGFRRGRRLEDNLFTLTQCIAIARREKRAMITCFLDIAKAYDCIPHTMLLKILKQLNMPETWMTLIQRLYDKKCFEKGLRQGCLLSPTLYMLYASSMERALEKTAIGFSLTHLQHGEVITWRLHGLAYADDLVLMADSVGDMRKLLATCETEADQLQLRFNAHKSATVIFSREEESIEPFILQGAAIPVCTKYRHLGLTLSATENYLAEYHQNLRTSSVRKRNILRRRCLWSCDQYVVTRELWKAVAAPGLTFGNSVISIPSELREYLERRQRDVGRQALGCHGQVATELARGASSKLEYYARLRHMDEDRWARRLFIYIHLKNIHSTWRNRVTHIGTKFGAFCMSDEPQAEKYWVRKVRTQIKAVERERWTLGMQQHTSMHLYASFKTEIAPITFCRNTLGSHLLIEAHGGALRTRHACGGDEETTEHLLLTCQRLLPAPIGDSRIEQALGFTNEHDHVARSKQRLEAWWKVRR